MCIEALIENRDESDNPHIGGSRPASRLLRVLAAPVVARRVALARDAEPPLRNTDKEQHLMTYPFANGFLPRGAGAPPPATSGAVFRETRLRAHPYLHPVAHCAAFAILLCVAAMAPAQAETRRLCDRRVTFDVVPPVDVPAHLSALSGIWKGTVIMAGGSEMCLSMVVKEVFPDGRVHLLMTWNLSMGGREDINNYVGMGEALHWPNKVENGEIRIDSKTRYNGVHYYYVMKVPTDSNPDMMEGRWMTDTHPQPVVLHRERR